MNTNKKNKINNSTNHSNISIASTRNTSHGKINHDFIMNTLSDIRHVIKDIGDFHIDEI